MVKQNHKYKLPGFDKKKLKKERMKPLPIKIMKIDINKDILYPIIKLCKQNPNSTQP